MVNFLQGVQRSAHTYKVCALVGCVHLLCVHIMVVGERLVVLLPYSVVAFVCSFCVSVVVVLDVLRCVLLTP